MTGRYRVGVDIGGTFTDLVVMDTELGTTRTHKVPSTPDDPSEGMLRGLDDLGLTAEIGYLVHGTTAGLNALLSGTGERVALVTTDGFADVVALGRGGNRDIWNLRARNVRPLVDPADVRTVRERIRWDGSVEHPLDDDDVAELAHWITADGIATVAVCLLHAHRNPTHELALRESLLERVPGLSMVLSHEVSPEQGEFERTSTTVATAYVARTVDRYLSRLVGELAERGCAVPLQVMRSSGGVCSAGMVARQPIQTILSGPAGGVVAAQTLARGLDRPHLIAIDMGGTSSDVSLVVDGAMTLATESEIAGQVMRMPVVELHTIGAGGGSIARAVAGGLRVGPDSAGAAPGPACYGLGGEHATVTDAQVLLGRIDPEWFLGGRMRLDPAAAEAAIARLGDELGLDAVAVAEGILAVASSMMANAMRTLALRRGIDTRSFCLVAFGGAGPLHAAALADELGISEVVIPQAMGVLSAWGMLHADVRHDLSTPLRGSASDATELKALVSALDELRLQGRDLLDQEGVAPDEQELLASVEMRYAGQEHATAVAIDRDAAIDEIDEIAARFHATYARQYGHAMPDAPVELVNARIAAVGRVGARVDEPAAAPEGEPGSTSTRRIRVDGQDRSAAIVHRRDIGPARVVRGPAVVQEEGSTTLVPPGWSIRLGRMGALFMTKDRDR